MVGFSKHKTRVHSIFIALLVLLSFPAFSGSDKYGFVENKGQVVDQNNEVVPGLKYMYSNGTFQLQLHQNSFSYQLLQRETVGEKVSFTANRIDIKLEGANTNPEILAAQPSKDNFNYYTSGKSITNVRYFQKVTYQNIYPKIDLVFYLTDQQLKYDFIVHPGGNSNDIKLTYNGLQKLLKNRDGSITLKTEIGAIEEQIPAAYVNEKLVDVHFKKHQNSVSFHVPKYDKSKTLTIDPLLVWGTYYGSLNFEDSYDVTCDAANNIYQIGTSGSTIDIATTGAHQTSWGGGVYDSYIVKFDSDGNRIWGTYFGGIQSEDAAGIAVDNNGDVIAVGTTASSGLATTGAHQTTNYLFNAGYIAKFTSGGVLQWCTYYGSSYTYINGVTTDPSNNIIIVGNSNSDSLIATPGTHQDTKNALTDAFVAKFDALGNRVWGTYYGGSTNDRGVRIATDQSSNIVLVGYTESATDIATPGSHQDTYAGNDEGFVVKFDLSGTRLWGTYYGGTNDDKIEGVDINSAGEIAIAGYTKSTSGIATSGAHQPTSWGSSGDMILAKLDASGNRIWGTYFGEWGFEWNGRVAFDTQDNLILTGVASSSNNISTTGVQQENYSGGGDGVVSKFNSAGVRQWTSYYGGGGGDFIRAVATDSDDNIVVSGVTFSTNNIAAGNGHLQVFQGDASSGDAMLGKFYGTMPSETITAVVTSGSNYCPGDTIVVDYTITGTFLAGNVFTAELSNSVGNFPSPVVLGNLTSQTSGTITGIIPLSQTAGGGFRVRIVSTNPAIYGLKSAVNLAVNPLPEATISALSATTFCLGDSVTLLADPASYNSYQWLNNNTPIVGATDSSYTTLSSGTYNVITEANGCYDTTSTISVIASVPPVAAFTYSDSGLVVTFANTSTGATSWQWDFGNGFSTGLENPIHTYQSPGTYTVQLIVSDGLCSDTLEITFTIYALGLTNNDVPEIQVYPNPVTDVVFIDSPFENYNVEIFNEVGKLVKTTEYIQSGNPAQIDVSDLSSGTYLLKVVSVEKLEKIITLIRQ
jgi:PKD repeat protein